MSVDVIKFVDSIAASPTTRLDINDGVTWRTSRFEAPPPRLRRASSSNAMRDGINVSSSQYDSRVLTLGLTLVHTSEDAKATELQKLARELDRADNFLMYQPTGATKPVFFRLYRSDMSQLEQFTGLPSSLGKPTIELLAEPFAIGLRETLGPYTINNDPAAASAQMYADVTGVIGDVASPLVITDTSRGPTSGLLAVRQHGTPSDLTFLWQAESMAPGTDTTNPGGAADATMSGTGTTNYLRTTFATTATMTSRVSLVPLSTVPTTAQGLAFKGRYNLYACVRRSDNTSVMTAAIAMPGKSDTSAVPIPLTTSRQMVMIGQVSLTVPAERVGYGASTPGAVTLDAGLSAGISVKAARSSGAGTLDWDYFALIPADESVVVWSSPGATAPDVGVIDGYAGMIYRTEGGTGSIFAGTALLNSKFAENVAGGIPRLVPNQTNRLYFISGGFGTSGGGQSKSETNALTVDYWPLYLYVRPALT